MCQMCSHWTRDIPPCALSLRAGSRSLHVTRGIFLPKRSCPISLQVACNELFQYHTNMQLGNIGFTRPSVDVLYAHDNLCLPMHSVPKQLGTRESD